MGSPPVAAAYQHAMTLRAYKTFRLGPVNVTVSRSGMSTSVGGRRARVATRPGRRGTRVSYRLPGGYRLRKGRGTAVSVYVLSSLMSGSGGT
jgi:hypothetical protein